MERKSESLKTGKLAGTSMHCIMAFEKIPVKKLLIE
jgi:hypothetical protein